MMPAGINIISELVKMILNESIRRERPLEIDDEKVLRYLIQLTVLWR